MDFIINIITFVVFLGMCLIVSKLLMDSNFEKMFKQGKISSIKVAYFICVFVISLIIALCFREFILIIHNLIKF